ncbi:MAG TPA: SPOR domain-containing protein, partial [Firmicutes bacterium]|nr:SPOR domain-containing protein [Bacillota bacterium]
MAGRRIHRPETKRRSGGAGCLTQFLVAAVCAVALGYFFGSYLFKQTTAVKPPSSPAQQGQPAPATPAKPTPPAMPPSTAGKVSLPELTIFQVQLGAFSQKANADRLVDAIKKQGWPAEEVTAGNLIQTRAGSFFGRQRAEALKEKYTADQLRPVVATKVLPAKDLTYEAAKKEY